MNEVNDMLDKFHSALREARKKLDEYQNLPKDQQDPNVLLKLIDDVQYLEEIDDII